MGEHALDSRMKVPDELLFHRVAKELLEKFRKESDEELRREKLTATLGIADTVVLDHFVQLGSTAETIVALAISPLVQVALSDGKLDDQERQAILWSAAQNVIALETSTRELLSKWLAERPDDLLSKIWREYLSALGVEYPANNVESNKARLLGRVEEVAEEPVGMCGLGDGVSGPEELTLAKLEEAFVAG